MTFNSSEAWLLEAIKLSEQENNGAALASIVATADYINHSILTFSEFDTGLKKLVSAGIVIIKDKQLHTSDEFKKWWNKKYGTKRINLIKAMIDIEKYLNETYTAFDNQLSESLFMQNEFESVVVEYLKPK